METIIKISDEFKLWLESVKDENGDFMRGYAASLRAVIDYLDQLEDE